MTWGIYDVDGKEQTSWYCNSCGYSADEDESKEKECPVCRQKGAVLLTREGETFYWCVLCGGYRDQAA